MWTEADGEEFVLTGTTSDLLAASQVSPVAQHLMTDSFIMENFVAIWIIRFFSLKRVQEKLTFYCT